MDVKQNACLPVILVAARMSSSRLPGKALMPFGDKPLLSHVVEAASSAEGASQVVVVTSQDRSDDPLARWCASNHVIVWRGELDDVASRMISAAKHVGAESFVRISGDSPMIDPRIITFAIQRFNRLPCDLVTNANPRTFPSGQLVEVVRTQTLDRLLSSRPSAFEDHEHVTPILYRNENEIRIARFSPADMQPLIGLSRGPYRSMTVDTPEDAACFSRVIHLVGESRVWTYGWEQCEALMRSAYQQIQDSSGA